MGCVNRSSIKNSNKEITRTSTRKYSENPSLPTTSGSLEFNLQPTSQKKPCSVEIKEEDGQEILKNYQLLIDLGVNSYEEYKFVAELVSIFNYNFLLFKNSVHGSCILEFTLTKGILINLLYSGLNTPDLLVCIKNSFPFFSINSSSFADFRPLFEFLQIIKHVNENQELVKNLLHLQYIAKSLKLIEICDIHPEYLQALNLIEDTVNCGKSLIAKVGSLFEELKRFYDYYQSVADVFEETSRYFQIYPENSTEEIVHYLISDLNQTGFKLSLIR